MWRKTLTHNVLFESGRQPIKLQNCGAAVGFASVLEARGLSGYLRVVCSVLDEVPLRIFPQLAALSGPMGYYYLDRLQAGLSDEDVAVWCTALSRAEAEETLYIAQPFHCAIGRKPW